MPGFRVNRKKFGLTWSAEVDQAENAITSAHTVTDDKDLAAIVAFLETKGRCDYLVSREDHASGKKHYHSYVKYDDSIDSTDARLFDLCGLHPNILSPSGKGWENYVAKHGEFVSNYYKRDPWRVALGCDTAAEAIEHLWSTMPGEMCKHSHVIEENVRKRMRKIVIQKRFEGPYWHSFYPPDAWDMNTHSLLMVGPPGIGKTQFARYLLGECNYVKGTLESLRTCDFSLPILFDEIHMLGQGVDPEQSKEITDVENGGTIKMRNKDVVIPPGVPRIFLSNMEYPFRDPNKAVYDRRVFTHRI